MDFKVTVAERTLILASTSFFQNLFKAGDVVQLQVLVRLPLGIPTVQIGIVSTHFLNEGDPLWGFLDAGQQPRGTFPGLGVLTIKRHVLCPVLHSFLFHAKLQQCVADRAGILGIIAEFLLSLLHPVPDSTRHRRIIVSVRCYHQSSPVITSGPFGHELQQMLSCRLTVFGFAVIRGGFKPPESHLEVEREAGGVLSIDPHVFSPLVARRVVAEPFRLSLQQHSCRIITHCIECRRLQQLIADRFTRRVLIAHLSRPGSNQWVGIGLGKLLCGDVGTGGKILVLTGVGNPVLDGITQRPEVSKLPARSQNQIQIITEFVVVCAGIKQPVNRVCGVPVIARRL